MNQTANYQLSQWEASDRILMSDFNSDNSKIDAALKAHDDDIAALETAVAGKGNCQLYYTTYVGTGQVGASAPNSLTFPAQPLLVTILQPDGTGIRCQPGSTGATFYWGDETFSVILNWSGNTLSWYSTGINPVYQQNLQGVTYHVYALFLAD